MRGVSTPLFRTGQVVATPLALECLRAGGIEPADLISRHVNGDWGDVSATDRQQNDNAVRDGDYPIVSAYELTTGARVFIVTEADRSVTTLLCPDER